MKLQISKSKNSTSLYVAKSIYVKGKRTTKIVEKLGTVAELEPKLNGQDPIQWAKAYIAELNRNEKEEKQDVMVKYSPTRQLAKDESHCFNGGYLFLQKLYHQLGIPDICQQISERHKFEFDLNSILSRLVYTRILFPSSKRAACQLSREFLQPPNFELHHIYRALEILAKENQFIQAQLYRNSRALCKRNTAILYYDCTNYFFEIEQEAGCKQYGPSKQHQPSPIVQMGLFMDADGIPLAFHMRGGNENEQQTLRPLEEKILKDFGLSRFVVCTDAGLSSLANRQFNNKEGRAFVTTQSIKKLKQHLQQWALDPSGWRVVGRKGTFHLTQLQEAVEDNEKQRKALHEVVFYKERPINDNGLEQRLVITFSFRYQAYQRSIRCSQIQRAQHSIEQWARSVKVKNPNDFRRFISQTHCTKSGEIADANLYHIDTDRIAQEEVFDGFYAVCTNLQPDLDAADSISDILTINQRRWQIEECFRIMKSEFKARPVFLERDDRIEAHFLTCFMALLLHRLLERTLHGRKPTPKNQWEPAQFTTQEIIHTLRNMNFMEVKGDGYLPTYTRTDLTDALHDAFGFRTDFQIVPTRLMKKIFKATQS